MLSSSPPESTGEMIALGEYMLNVKNKVMHTLNEEIECSKGRIEGSYCLNFNIKFFRPFTVSY